MPWMTDVFNQVPGFPNRVLSDITIPGTHDAGCYVDRWNNFQSRTQLQTIGGQLNAGIRYFDIRPYLTNNQFWTYHGPFYTGGQLDGIAGILNDVANFMNALAPGDRELVILNISHFNAFNNAAHAALIPVIQNALNNHLVPYTQAQTNLFGTAYNALLTDNAGPPVTRSRVAILYDGALDTAIEPYVAANNLPAGFFKLSPKYAPPANQIFLFDQYANSGSTATMQQDQLNKLRNRNNYAYTQQAWGAGAGNWNANAAGGTADTMHLFSWTLTPQPWSDPITAAATSSNPALLPLFQGNNWGGALLPRAYDPTVDQKINIIYVDNFASQQVSSYGHHTSQAINQNGNNCPRNGMSVPVALAEYFNRYHFNAMGNAVWGGWNQF